MQGRIGPWAGGLLPGMDRKETGNRGRKAAAPFGLPEDALPHTETGVRKRMKQLQPKTPTVEMVQSSDDMW